MCMWALKLLLTALTVVFPVNNHVVGDVGSGEATSGDNAINDHLNLYPVNPPPMPPSPSCVQCADRPSPWMQNRGRSCAMAANYISSKRCNKDVRWDVERYCEVTCEANGVGYAGKCCSQTAPLFPPSFPPSIPPLLPPLLPPRKTPLIAPSPCIICNDKPTPYMERIGKSCASWATFITRRRCNASRSWSANNFCQRTCDANGVGYYTGMCCSQPAPPSLPPSFPPSIPPILPPLLPPLLPPRESPIETSPCIICTDKPTPYMESISKSCASWVTFITRRRCIASSYWLANHFCERTCDANGVGYYASIHWGCAPLNRTPDCLGSPMQILTPSTRAPFVSHLMGIASNCSFGRAETCAVNVKYTVFFARVTADLT